MLILKHQYLVINKFLYWCQWRNIAKKMAKVSRNSDIVHLENNFACVCAKLKLETSISHSEGDLLLNEILAWTSQMFRQLENIHFSTEIYKNLTSGILCLPSWKCAKKNTLFDNVGVTSHLSPDLSQNGDCQNKELSKWASGHPMIHASCMVKKKIVYPFILWMAVARDTDPYL